MIGTVSRTADVLQGQDRFLILTHRRPDGDTVGCADALCRVLRALGKQAVIWDNPDFRPSQRQRRADLIMELQAPIMDDYCNSFLGKTIRVLYEYYDEESGYHVGRSYADSPDIDGLVLFSGDCAEGDMVDVLITDTDEGLLIGEQV